MDLSEDIVITAQIKLQASISAKIVGFVCNDYFELTDEFPAKKLGSGKWAIMFPLEEKYAFQTIETLITMAGGYGNFIISPSYFEARALINHIEPALLLNGAFNPGIELYTHQKQGINRVNKLLYNGILEEGYEFLGLRGAIPNMMGGSLDLSDPGTGKTGTALGIMALVTKVPGAMRNLVVCPPGLAEQWARETEIFVSPRFRGIVQSFYKLPEKIRDEALTHWLSRNDSFVGTLIIGYPSLRSHIDELVEQKWNCVVFDECQALCDPKTRQTQAAKRLSASAKVGWVHGMSGTVLRNSAADAHSIFTICRNPIVIGRDTGEPISYEAFKEAHAEVSTVKLDRGPIITVLKNIKGIETFSKYVVANSFRVPRDSSLFPKTTDRIVKIPMSPYSEKIYSLLEMYGSCTKPGSQLSNFMADEEVIGAWRMRRQELLAANSEDSLVSYLDALSKMRAENNGKKTVENSDSEDWDGLEDSSPEEEEIEGTRFDEIHGELLADKANKEMQLLELDEKILEIEEKISLKSEEYEEQKNKYSVEKEEVVSKAISSLTEEKTPEQLVSFREKVISEWRALSSTQELIEKGRTASADKKLLESEKTALVAEKREISKVIAEAEKEIKKAVKLVRESLRAERTGTLRNLARLCGGHESVFDTDGERKYICHVTEKLEWLAEFVKERTTPIIVFALYTPEIESIAKKMEEIGVTYDIISGKTPDKGESIRRFWAWLNKEDYPPGYAAQVIICQEKAGAEGHNLQCAQDLVSYSWSHSGSNDTQKRARMDRMKATYDSVTFWYLELVFSDGSRTVDGEILDAVQGKKRLLSAVSVATTTTKIPPEIEALKDVAPDSYAKIIQMLGIS